MLMNGIMIWDPINVMMIVIVMVKELALLKVGVMVMLDLKTTVVTSQKKKPMLLMITLVICNVTSLPSILNVTIKDKN